MLYEYSYIDANGEIKKGEIEATDIESANNRIIQEEQKIPLEVKVGKIKREKGKKGRTKVKPKELLIFTKHFSMIINAGIGLRNCFEILALQEEKKHFKPIITGIKTDIDGGHSLTRAFGKYPRIFSQFYLSMLEISELSGTLKGALGKVVETLEQDIKRKAQIKSAMVYPAIIVLVAIAVLIFMLVAIIPKFMVMFEGTGIEMPALTMAVVNLSDLLREKWYYFVGGIIIGIVALKKILAIEKFKYTKDKWVLKIPLIGKFVNFIVVSQILRNMSTLLAAGVSFTSTFEIVNRSIDNLYFRKSMDEAESSINDGSTIAMAFEKTGDFPVIVNNMIKIGEQSGKLIESLDNSYEYIEEEVDVAVKSMLTALEPIIILFVSIGVGILVIAMYLPLFKMSEMAG